MQIYDQASARESKSQTTALKSQYAENRSMEICRRNHKMDGGHQIAAEFSYFIQNLDRKM